MGFPSGFEKIVRTNESLAKHTWFQLGGPAQYLVEPENSEQLAAVVRRTREEALPLRLLGSGSNLLVREGGVPGVVLRLAGDGFNAIRLEKNMLLAGGAAKLGHAISSAVRGGLGGLEALVGIPGTVGGAIHGNAGSKGGDVGQWTAQVTVMNAAGEISERKRDELVFAYRESSVDDLVILGAHFALESDDPEELTKRMQKQWIVRKAAQPLDHLSAGCIFKNPRGMSAGMLIDQSGLKGSKVGNAEVSDRHANFIVANEGATPSDVLKLIDVVKERVQERMGVELELEIEVW